jgi:hypothetical protein
MWQVPINNEHTWRIQLENVQTGEKRGFTRLEDLLSYLNLVTTQDDDSPGEGCLCGVQG